MSSRKRIKGNYYIESLGAADEVFIETKNVTIEGNLTVTGETAFTTTIESTDLVVSDNTIILNAGEQGSGITLNTSGIEIDRGLLANVGLRYNETEDRWEASDDGTVWYPLDAALTLATFELEDDLTPQLGGNLDVNGYVITSEHNGDIVVEANGEGEFKINQGVSLVTQDSSTYPYAVTGYNKLYAKDPDVGDTGLFVLNSTVDDELISYRKALFLSLIF